MQTVNLFNELFLSTEIWGYFGSFILVAVGFYIAKKDRMLAVLWFIIECLAVVYYYDLFTTTDSFYVWHFFIVLMGAVLILIPMIDRT